MVELAGSNESLLRVPELADRLGTSERTLQRLAARYVGLTPVRITHRSRDARDRTGLRGPVPPHERLRPGARVQPGRLSPNSCGMTSAREPYGDATPAEVAWLRVVPSRKRRPAVRATAVGGEAVGEQPVSYTHLRAHETD